MRKHPRPLIIGNWKQNPATLARAERLWLSIQKNLKGRRAFSDVAIAPPLPFITELQQLSGTQKVELFSQDVSYHQEGAHTGEVSVDMLRSIKVRGSIVGHSERRAAGETDEAVNKKISALVAAKSNVIVCVGESERDTYGDYFTFIEQQIQKALLGVSEADISRVVIAYEPIWAIGTDTPAGPLDIQEMKLFIQKVLAGLYPRASVEKLRILYGGSVNANNAEPLLKEGEADGFLIGGASLDAKQFAEIVKIADQYEKFS